MNTVSCPQGSINDAVEINASTSNLGNLDRKDHISKTLDFLHPDGAVFELTCIEPGMPKSDLWEGYAAGKKPLVIGWFDDQQKAAEIALALDSEVKPSAIYIGLNPCDPALLARASQRLKAGVNRTTAEYVLSLNNLLIDFDPVRPSGISSTDREHQLALEKALEVGDYLSEAGWPPPLIGDPGNGGHLVYKIHLENTPENVEIIRKCLRALNHMFGTKEVEIDQKVYDPPRISKLYGTIARKGDDIPERPHRPALIISVPGSPQPVPYELLKSLAESGPIEMNSPRLMNTGKPALVRFDVQAYLEKHDVPIKKVKQHGSAMLYILEECLFNPDHAGGESAIGQTETGTLFYFCFHNSCKDRTWAEARQIISGDEKIGISPGHNTGGEGNRQEKAAGEKPTKIHLMAPPRFPLDVFPPRTQAVLEDIARAHTVPVEVPAAALLVLSGASIGQTRALKIKHGWYEHPNLYIALVGRSGVGKSPATKRIFRPVFEMEKQWYDEYQEQVRAMQEGNEGSAEGRPTWRQLIVEDASPEALSEVLAGNPRGIMWYRDEFAGLLLEMDKYSGKNGATKTRLMSAYDSGSWKVNRISSNRNTFIQHATLSIFGTVQPMALPEIFSSLDSATGFLPRFIFLRADRDTPPFWTDEVIQQATNKALADMIHTFLNFDFDGDDKPLIVNVGPAARMRYIEWYNQQVSEPWRDLNAGLYEALSAKLRGQCLRLCLILHCMQAAEKGCSELEPVSESTMLNAIRLTDCFKQHQKQIWQFLVNPADCEELSPLQKRVIQAILNLENSIRGGMLPTALITERVNNGIDTKFHASSMTIGRVATSLGFVTKHLPGETTRGICVTADDLERLKPLVEYSGTSGSTGRDPMNFEIVSLSIENKKSDPVHPSGKSINDGTCLSASSDPGEQIGQQPETTYATCTVSSEDGKGELSEIDMLELLFNAKIELNSSYNLKDNCFEIEKLKEVWESNVASWKDSLRDDLFQNLVEYKDSCKRDIEPRRTDESTTETSAWRVEEFFRELES